MATKEKILIVEDEADLVRLLRHSLEKEKFRVTTDDAGSIGKRYRRQDEIGTPFGVTIDYDTLTNQTVTIRHRDTMAQERVSTDKLVEYIEDKFETWGK